MAPKSSQKILPENLTRLHIGEEDLRQKASVIVLGDVGLILHLQVVEAAMDLADLLRQHGSDSEDLKVLRLLGMRMFNALASSLKLVLSGYSQTSVLILRDVLETVFLFDLFNYDPKSISEWRLADKKTKREKFGPASVRKALDDRDGNTKRKREKIYELFSELAAHPTMKSDYMLRAQVNGDALIGPFIEASTLKAVLDEMGKLAIQVGELLSYQVNKCVNSKDEYILPFSAVKARWFAHFT